MYYPCTPEFSVILISHHYYNDLFSLHCPGGQQNGYGTTQDGFLHPSGGMGGGGGGGGGDVGGGMGGGDGGGYNQHHQQQGYGKGVLSYL